jgi:hypothetical protein
MKMSNKERILKELSHLSEDELIQLKDIMSKRKKEKINQLENTEPGYLKTRKALRNINLNNIISEERNERI